MAKNRPRNQEAEKHHGRSRVHKNRLWTSKPPEKNPRTINPEFQTSVGRKEERVSDDGKRSSQTEFEEYAHWMDARCELGLNRSEAET